MFSKRVLSSDRCHWYSIENVKFDLIDSFALHIRTHTQRCNMNHMGKKEKHDKKKKQWNNLHNV